MNAYQFRFFVCCLLGIAATGVAQQRGQREPARCVGKLVGIAPGVLQVETDKGERMLVAIEARPEDISFQGTATQAFLQPGMLVQFSAMVDKKGEAQEEIREIKVVSPRMGTQIGVQADGGFTGGELFASNDDAAAPKKKRARNEAAAYLVTGTVRSIKDGKMYVAAGPTIKAELADNCQVNFDISDLRFAREGDSVEVTQGWRFPNQATQMYANRLTVITEKVLGQEEKKRRPGAKTDEKADDAKKSSSDEKSSAEKPSDEKEGGKKAELKKGDGKKKGAEADKEE